MATIQPLQDKVEMASIAKNWKRNAEESMRAADPEFRFEQRFRVGIEGSISFLKRIPGLSRCVNNGWEHFVNNVAGTIFTNNALSLATE